jgi:cytochrome c oxidase subunit 2
VIESRRKLVLGTIVLAAGGATGVLRAQSSAPRVIPVVARKFVFLPRDIHLKVGEAVVFEFTAPEVVMGFYAPDLDLRALIIPGQVAKLPFTAKKAGRFAFLCDIFCGDGHEGMSGEIVVA